MTGGSRRAQADLTRRALLWTTPVALAVVPAPAFAASAGCAPGSTAYGTATWTYASNNLDTNTGTNGVQSYGGSPRFLSVSDAKAGGNGTCSYTTQVSLVANRTYSISVVMGANYGSNTATGTTGQQLQIQVAGVTYWKGATRATPGYTPIAISYGGTTVTTATFTYTPATTGFAAFTFAFTVLPPPASGLGSDDIGVAAPTITC